MSLEFCIFLSTDTVRDLLVVGAVPAGGRVEDVLVGIKVVGCALVVMLNDVDKDELGVFLGLGRKLVMLGADMRSVAVI